MIYEQIRQHEEQDCRLPPQPWAARVKKAIVRTLDGEVAAGMVPATGFVVEDAGAWQVELLDTAGRRVLIPLERVLTIAWVRDFNLNDRHNPERLERRTFLARPRSEGLWVRLTLRGAAPLEGLAALDLGLLDGMRDEHGMFMTPPDTRGNTQRLFVPRSAMEALEVVAVVTTPTKKARAAQAEASGQGALFGG